MFSGLLNLTHLLTLASLFHLHLDQVGLLAAVGVTEVQVAVTPSVAVLSTGAISHTLS